MTNFWDERFGQPDYVYGKLPNEFLKNQLAMLTPGKILFPAEGEGRNAVYVATQNWQVDAFDSSVEGQKKAHTLASDFGVSINYSISTYQDFHTDEKYDVIALIYAHIHESYRSVFHSRVMELLKPGGLVILEAFTPAQLSNSSGGPKDLALLYSLDQLKNDFSGLETIIGEEMETELHEGAFHEGKANVVRFVGRKP